MNIKKSCFLGFPWLLAQAFSHHPAGSYFLAYAGSFFIFYETLLSPRSQLNPKEKLTKQVMNPIVLIQLIFAGFMCCTSVFCMAEHLGLPYFNLHPDPVFRVNAETFLLAKCQRMVLLGHLALVIGIQSQMKVHTVQRYFITIPINSVLIRISLCTIPFITLFDQFPSLIQFKYYLISITATCGTFLLVNGLAQRKIIPLLFGGAIFTIHILDSTLTGYKETLIVSFIMLSFLLLEHFKKVVYIFFLPGLLFLFYVLPTLTILVRNESWKDKKPAKTACAEAYESFFSGNNEAFIASNNRAFLTNRLSETKMFVRYLSFVPDEHPYYGLEILKNSTYALIPRVFWPQKPNTEQIAMERVYDAGAVSRMSVVSAKTRPVIDGYLTGGMPVVFLSMFVYGLVAQWLANQATILFGGYKLGCAVIFNSIFQPLWRGNNWEFLMNNILYGYLLMILIFYLLKQFNLIQPYDKNDSNYPVIPTL